MSITFICLAAFFTWFSFKRPNLLISLITGLLWFALAMWLFFGTTPLFDLAELYVQILSWVFVVMTFVPFLALMDTEIRHEKEGHSWSSWGQEPKRKTPSGYEAYREKLYGRTRRGR